MLTIVIATIVASSAPAVPPPSALVDTIQQYARLTDHLSPGMAAALNDLRGRGEPPGGPVAVAAAVGLPLLEVPEARERLLALAPVIVELCDPPGYAVLTGADDEWVQWVDGPGLHLAAVRRETAVGRMTGLAWRTAEQPPGGPRIRIEHPHHVLGRGYLGTQLSHGFAIQNTGDELLKVTTRSASCSCARATRDAIEVAPGQTAELRIDVRLPQVGEVFEWVWLFTNDPLRPLLPVSLGAEGLFGVTVYPDQVRLAASLAGGEETAVRVVAPLALRITEAACEPAECDVRIERRTEEEGIAEYILILRARPGAAGRRDATLIIRTAHPDYARLDYAVHPRRR